MNDEDKTWWQIPPKPEDMEKLDQFAGLALSALIANDKDFELSFDKAADLAFEYAYFMMRERRRYK